MAKRKLTGIQKTYQFLKSHLAFSLIGIGVFLLVLTMVVVGLNQGGSEPDSAAANDPVNSSKPGGFLVPRPSSSSISSSASNSSTNSSVYSSLSSSSSVSSSQSISVSSSSSSSVVSSSQSSNQVSSTSSSSSSSSVSSSSSSLSSTSSTINPINSNTNTPSKGDPVKGQLVEPPTTGETVRSGGADVLIGGLLFLAIIISYLVYRNMKKKSALATKEKKLK